ncbi:MAG: ECF RNA polymerase sigma factor SigE [Pelotomaculum sp. PtaB.Bin104]|nr:MAG: ECF RNA polymerase sigma factor SigE [Pelotomaculum sp. PtaB.Bin104]
MSGVTPVGETRILVTKAKDNDIKAFEELVRIYQNKVYALSLKLSGNHEDAQDVAQETFIRAYRSLGNFRNDADFGTWLHRITVNVWLNMRRKKYNNNIISLDEPYQWDGGNEKQREVADSNGEDPLQVLEARELQQLIRSAVLSLSEEHRAVIILRDMEGYSYEEISRMMSCSLGTVKSRINRAREVMRRNLTEMARETGRDFPAGKERR